MFGPEKFSTCLYTLTIQVKQPHGRRTPKMSQAEKWGQTPLAVAT